MSNMTSQDWVSSNMARTLLVTTADADTDATKRFTIQTGLAGDVAVEPLGFGVYRVQCPADYVQTVEQMDGVIGVSDVTDATTV